MSRIVVTTIVRLWDSPAATAVTALCSPLTMTGVRLPVVVPLPSWPSWLLPQARTWRIHVSARLWKPPPAMEVTVVPAGRLTAIGLRLPVVVPLPSCPELLAPQARTWPGEVNARLWASPPETAVTEVPEGRLTPTGVRALAVVPLPSWPELLKPQASTWPVDVRARLWLAPAAMAVTVVPEARLAETGTLKPKHVPMQPPSPRCPSWSAPQPSTLPAVVRGGLGGGPTAVTVVPEGRLTDTGVLLFVRVPLPSWPRLLRPQAKTLPVDVTARLWNGPAAIAVTIVPVGRLTKIGVLLLVVVPLPSWP